MTKPISSAAKLRLFLYAITIIAVAYTYGLIGEGEHFLQSALAFIVIISVIVFVHEFGHYIVAKWAGVKIDTFSLGFGKEIFGWNDSSGTRWRVSSLPLGGYVKMYGDATEASTPVEEIEHFTAEQRSKAFYYKPLYKKAAIVAAGPIFNFLLTILIITVFAYRGGIFLTEPVVGGIKKDSPAEAAGLRPEDRILSINGEKVEFFSDISQLVFTNLDAQVTLQVERSGKTFAVTLAPEVITEKGPLGEVSKHPIIGIISKELKATDVGLGGAVWAATRETYYRCAITLRVVGQIIMGKRSAKDSVSGPLAMAKLSGQAAEKGVSTVFWWIAIISANLGLVNLFPIPVLDGGHLAFYAIEAVLRRPPGKRFQEYSTRVGMALVAMLMTFAILNDIRNWMVSFLPQGAQ